MSVEADGIDDAQRVLEDLRARLLDMSPVLKVIGEDLKTFIDDRFDTSTDPTGRKWAPLAPATIKRRRRGSDKPLIDTGQLRNSINTRADAQRLQFGTNVPYAAPHQFGTVRIPARRFLPIDGGPGGTFTITKTGLAGTEWAAYRQMITDYLKTGRVG